MSLTMELKQHEYYLEIIAKGMYSHADAVMRFSHLLDTCILTGQAKMLIDISQMQQPDSATEKVFYAVSVERRYDEYLNNGGHPLRVAYLTDVVGSYEPGRDIARIVGLPFELFDDRTKALQWLETETGIQS